MHAEVVDGIRGWIVDVMEDQPVRLSAEALKLSGGSP